MVPCPWIVVSCSSCEGEWSQQQLMSSSWGHHSPGWLSLIHSLNFLPSALLSPPPPPGFWCPSTELGAEDAVVTQANTVHALMELRVWRRMERTDTHIWKCALWLGYRGKSRVSVTFPVTSERAKGFSCSSHSSFIYFFKMFLKLFPGSLQLLLKWNLKWNRHLRLRILMTFRHLVSWPPPRFMIFLLRV